MIDSRFVTLQDCDDAVRVSTPVEKPFGSLEKRCDRCRVLSRKDEELEARISGR